MWNDTTDLDSWMNSFTLAMTNEIREQGIVDPRTKNNYAGYATEFALFVHVQWLWLRHPGLLSVASCISCFTLL